MVTVGIIANPASGKDIRRLVAYGSVFDNQEKVNIVRRVLLGLEAAGVDEVIFMPDYFGIGPRAVDGARLSMQTSILDMPLRATQEDSTQAAALMRERGIGCIVTIGGDGTNRAVAKGCGEVYLMPVSTGTNNVFPYMIEGTIAGLAAGVVAAGTFDSRRLARRTKRLEVKLDGRLIDIALVDAVVYADLFIASRAIWDMSKVKEIILTRAEPDNIGLSSVGGNLYCARFNRRHGVYIRLGDGPLEVTAPIAPGLIGSMGIAGYKLLSIGDQVEVACRPSLLALDGEREIEIGKDDEMSIQLSAMGPLVVDVRRALQCAAKANLFTRLCGGGSMRTRCAMREANLCLAPLDSCLALLPKARDAKHERRE